ncbi:hypothetical protein [Reinekea sp. G2M2-21]|uniref:hypothetical protein n=1 Tax=Reinekea sp. G2M2-21 TaxID=2788942 RepID=UPI0018AB1A08|nr:hypothetical protein [Reinekea sp. G2M2-21]
MKNQMRKFALAALALPLSTSVFAEPGFFEGGLNLFTRIALGLLALLMIAVLIKGVTMLYAGGTAIMNWGKDQSSQGGQGSTGPDNKKAALTQLGGGIIMLLIFGIVANVAVDFAIGDGNPLRTPDIEIGSSN